MSVNTPTSTLRPVKEKANRCDYTCCENTEGKVTVSAWGFSAVLPERDGRVSVCL